MHVHVEHLTSLVRLWISPEAKYGDAYDWVVTVRWLDKENVEFIGMTVLPTREMWRAIRAELRRLGVKTILAHRTNGGRDRKKIIHTAPRKEREA